VDESEITQQQQAVLTVLDEQIAELERKLAEVQPLIDELNRLKRTRATLLSERPAQSRVGRRPQLTADAVVQAFREHGDMTANQLADRTGVDPTVARSHLNRYRDDRYTQGADGVWSLIAR
jgi:hypothetical protein